MAIPCSATVTITSDEVLPPTVSVAATDATATEAGLTTGTFTVTRTGATTSALTVLYSPSGTPNSATVTLSSDDVGVPPGPDGEVSLTAQSAYDNKTRKTYIVGGPDGVDPLNDLNTLAEEYKFEIEAGSTFWWEATYADPVVGSEAPSEVLVTVQ